MEDLCLLSDGDFSAVDRDVAEAFLVPLLDGQNTIVERYGEPVLQLDWRLQFNVVSLLDSWSIVRVERRDAVVAGKLVQHPCSFAEAFQRVKQL